MRAPVDFWLVFDKWDLLADINYHLAWFTFPTGPAKPEEFGSGIPVQFGRLPVGTGQI